jgi:hypothetical protein
VEVPVAVQVVVQVEVPVATPVGAQVLNNKYTDSSTAQSRYNTFDNGRRRSNDKITIVSWGWIRRPREAPIHV